MGNFDSHRFSNAEIKFAKQLSGIAGLSRCAINQCTKKMFRQIVSTVFPNQSPLTPQSQSRLLPSARLAQCSYPVSPETEGEEEEEEGNEDA